MLSRLYYFPHLISFHFATMHLFLFRLIKVYEDNYSQSFCRKKEKKEKTNNYYSQSFCWKKEKKEKTNKKAIHPSQNKAQSGFLLLLTWNFQTVILAATFCFIYSFSLSLSLFHPPVLVVTPIPLLRCSNHPLYLSRYPSLFPCILRNSAGSASLEPIRILTISSHSCSRYRISSIPRAFANMPCSFDMS